MEYTKEEGSFIMFEIQMLHLSTVVRVSRATALGQLYKVHGQVESLN